MLTNDEYKFILEHYVQELERDIKIYRDRIENCKGSDYSMWYVKLETTQKHLADLKYQISCLTNSSGLSFMKGEEHD